MRLIDVDKVGLTDFETVMCDGDFKEAFKLLCEKLDDTPTVDAVEVVRCKDCKYSEHWYRDKARCFLWNEDGIEIFEDGYCNYGRRKEMPNMMIFPETVEEFMEQYKIVDSEEVYTNRAELVPISRMKQWFEHTDTKPVKHSRWVRDGFGSRCSACGLYAYRGDDGEPWESPYCPICGAKMDGVE